MAVETRVGLSRRPAPRGREKIIASFPYISKKAKERLLGLAGVISTSVRETIVELSRLEYIDVSTVMDRIATPIRAEEVRAHLDMATWKRLDAMSDQFGIYGSKSGHGEAWAILDAILRGLLVPSAGGSLEDGLADAVRDPLAPFRDLDPAQMVVGSLYLSPQAVSGLRGLITRRKKAPRRLSLVITNLALENWETEFAMGQLSQNIRHRHIVHIQNWVIERFAQVAMDLPIPIRPSSHKPFPLAAAALEGIGSGDVALTIYGPAELDSDPEPE